MSNGNSGAALQPVKGKPGMFLNKLTGKYTYIAEWREDNKYDTVYQASSTQSAGTEKNFFRDLSNKYYDATNFTTARRLPAGEEMIVDRLWCYVKTCYGNTLILPADFKKICENAYVKFQINRKDVGEGPLFMFPSGYGLTGMTNENNQGIFAIGVPSTAAAAKLKREQYVTSDHDLDAVIKYYDQTGWPTASPTQTSTSAAAYLMTGLHGLVRAAATK
jgi:hypothetical protein